MSKAKQRSRKKKGKPTQKKKVWIVPYLNMVRDCRFGDGMCIFDRGVMEAAPFSRTKEENDNG